MEKVYQRKPFRCLIGGCARGVGVAVAAPIKIPKHWSRVLRLTPTPKLRIEDFLQV